MNIAVLANTGSVHVHEDAVQTGTAVARRVAELAAQAIAARGAFRLVLAGGETPRRCYEQLRDMAVDWTHVEIFFGDERCLPPGDPQRNDTMARAALLAHIVIAPENIHAIPAERGAQQAAAAYAALLQDAAPFDLILLGMGEDGHTASLFPGNPALESSAPVVPVFDAPKPPPERVSLGMNTLNAAHRCIFLVAGSGKRDALERIARGEKLPAARVTGAEWHLDRAAWPE